MQILRSAGWRILWILAAGLSGFAVYQTGEVSATGLAMLAQVVLAGLTFACLTAALLPQSLWEELKLAGGGLIQARNFEDSKRLGFVLIVVASLTYLAITAEMFCGNKTSQGQDEQAYLVTAEEVHASGGPFSLIVRLYRGDFAEANRHPLYIALLSVWPTFPAGKLLSLGIGMLTVACTVGIGVRLIGWLRTGLLSVFLATNMAWCRFSITVGCEGLLALIAMLIWFQAPRIFGTDSHIGAKRAIGLQAAMAGVLLGLSWLTKGTGLLLLAGYACWLVIEWIVRRKQSPTLRVDNKYARGHWFLVIFSLALAWLAVASPLLVRNLRMHGSAFYNVNSWLMFADEYKDPVLLAKQPLGEAARDYWDSHTFPHIAKREVQGVIWEGFILTRMLGPVPFDDFRALPGAIVLMLAVLGAAILDWEPRSRLLLCWSLLFLLMFAWYVPVAAGERFVLPLLIPIGYYAALGLGHFLRTETRRKWAGGFGLAWCACSLILMWTGDWLEGRI